LPRYFFNIYHEAPNVDREGEELADKHAAWKEATQMAGHILQDLDGNFQPGQTWKLEVPDEFRNVCITSSRGKAMTASGSGAHGSR